MLSLITGKLGGRGAPATYTHDGVLRRRVPDSIGQKGYIMKIRRKLISAAVAALVLIGCIVPFGAAVSAAALPYTDVKSTDWFYESVLYAYENGLMNGMTPTTFEPKKSLSRAMFVTLLGRHAGAALEENDAFPDVPRGKWYSGYVGWAVTLGVVHGYEDGTFRPDASISRQEMAVAVSNYIKTMGFNMTTEGGVFKFADQEDVAAWAAPSLSVLRDTGVVAGDERGRFNPEDNITRAESAKVMMKLKLAIDNAWQGYMPKASDGSIILGAAYLYHSGSACSGGMAHELNSDGTYPILESYMDRYAAGRTYLYPNTVGVSLSYLGIDISTHPIVKICYSSDGIGGGIPSAVYTVNRTKYESTGTSVYEEITPTRGDDDCGMKTATVDLTATAAAHRDVNPETQIQNLVFEPCARDYGGDGRFKIAYIAFFRDAASADAYTAASDSAIDDYLKNYYVNSSLDYSELSKSDDEYYKRLISDRISEIKSADSALTPEKVKSAGGTCYYLSTVNGNDSNDGLSPATPWRSLSKLWREIPGGDLITRIRPGDGVFFERGSVWYPERYMNYQVYNLSGANGVSYGAYGEGEKPLFTCSLDFTSAGGAGRWLPTDWENVWELDPELIDSDPAWRGVYPHGTDIGNIIFNGGEGLGVRIVPGNERSLSDSVEPSAELSPFGEGKTSYDKGYVCNGYEYYNAGVADMTNPGTALTKNLEFIHDRVEGRLYLYFDGGNPGEYFTDIKVSRNGAAATFGNNTWVDNLTFMYSSTYGAIVGEKNIKFTNCEVGYVGGSISSVESGIEAYGRTDGSYMYDNYIHDICDGPITSQNGRSDGDKPYLIQNVEYIGNVIVACGNGAEIWNGPGPLDANGVGRDKMINITIRDNIMAYIGYGLTQMQDTGHNREGNVICGSIYGEMVDCSVEDNLYYRVNGDVYGSYVATYTQPRGWMARGNTYVLNPTYANIGYCYETLNRINHGMWKRARVKFTSSYEGLVWYTQLGVDPVGKYYYYTDMNEHESRDCFFMTGWWAEHGGFGARR